jgi:hypothetical protein
MTTTDIVLRINDAIRTGDQRDLDDLATQIHDLLIEETARDAWLALIETATDAIAGEFC